MTEQSRLITKEEWDEFQGLKEVANSYAGKPINYDIACETVNKLLDDIKMLKTKLNLAVKAMNAAGNYLACMDDLSELTGECNEQMALNELTKALDKIKEIKND